MIYMTSVVAFAAYVNLDGCATWDATMVTAPTNKANTPRQLNSDELGAYGEYEFPRRLVPAQLIANKSDRDRTGWDYIVEWPASAGKGDSLDLREAPPSCHVQVKTKWSGNDRVEARLSSLERLAKELKPSFIYVFECAEGAAGAEPAYTGARVIHVDGPFLAFVLRKLRKLRECEAAGVEANTEQVGFSLKKYGVPIEPTGAAFRAYVEGVVGDTLLEYAQNKRKQRQTVGFESGRFQLTTTLSAATKEDFVDAFLGLKPIDGKVVSSIETRFGVPLPKPFSIPEGTWEIRVSPFDSGSVRVWIPGRERPLDFRGKIYLPPKAVATSTVFKLLVRTDLFRLTMKQVSNGSGGPAIAVSMTMGGDATENPLVRAAQWADFYEFAASAATGPVRLQVAPDHHKAISGTASLDDADAHADHWAYMAMICRSAAKAMRRAGAPNAKLKDSDIAEAARDLSILEALMEDPSELTPLRFRSSIPEGLEDGWDTPLIYFRVLRLGGAFLAFAASCTVTAKLDDEGAAWSSGALKFVDVARPRSEAEIAGFIKRVQRRTKIGAYYLNGIEEEDAVTPS